jgi:hypothetical protein
LLPPNETPATEWGGCYRIASRILASSEPTTTPE